MIDMGKEILNKIDIETADKRERRKLILQLTWPALGENLLSTLVSLADSAMVPRWAPTPSRPSVW